MDSIDLIIDAISDSLNKIAEEEAAKINELHDKALVILKHN